MLGIEVGGVVTAALLLSALWMRARDRTCPGRTFLIQWRRLTYPEWKRRCLAPGLAIGVSVLLIGVVDVLH